MEMIRTGGRGILPLILYTTISYFLNNKIYPQPFKFAWMTDTHVGSTTGAADLINTVNDINTFNDIDFVILSGDVTETGKTTD